MQRIIEDSIEEYTDQVKVIHQYGIETEVQIEETDVEKPFNIYISGIDVYSAYEFSSRGCNFIQGVNHMNGEQALAFSRLVWNRYRLLCKGELYIVDHNGRCAGWYYG